MSYLDNGTGNGHLYIGHVKWSNDYKHTMLFTTVSGSTYSLSKSARNSFMTSHLSQVSDKVVYINPNQYVDVDGNIDGLDTKNYAYYYNDSDIGGNSSNRIEYCCFITNYEYIAPNVTRIYLELDVIQTYIYNTSFYRSFIERGHVANDAVGDWLAPEPVAVTPTVQREISTIGSINEWSPLWVLHSVSRYNSSTNKYEYGGLETQGGNTYGEYGTYITNLAQLQLFLTQYGKKSIGSILSDASVSGGDSQFNSAIGDAYGGTTADNALTAIAKVLTTTSASDIQDHRSEIIGIYAIPNWARGQSAEPYNTPTVKTENLSLTSTLASGYNPRNNKMLTSMCKAYMIYDENGTKIPYTPQLFNGSPSVTLSCSPMGTSGYYLKMNNYLDLAETVKHIPYSCERRVSYDGNTGLNKSINALTAGVSMISSAGAVLTAPSNPVAIINGTQSIINSSLNMVDALGQRGATIGSMGDLMTILETHPQLHWCDVSPAHAECEYIDDFLDTFGYAINELYAPRSWLYTRRYWNYIKTQNININAQAPAEYEGKIKDIFNAGITFWHDYDKYGRYDLSNSITGYTPD